MLVDNSINQKLHPAHLTHAKKDDARLQIFKTKNKQSNENDLVPEFRLNRNEEKLTTSKTETKTALLMALAAYAETIPLMNGQHPPGSKIEIEWQWRANTNKRQATIQDLARRFNVTFQSCLASKKEEQTDRSDCKEDGEASRGKTSRTVHGIYIEDPVLSIWAFKQAKMWNPDNRTLHRVRLGKYVRYDGKGAASVERIRKEPAHRTGEVKSCRVWRGFESQTRGEHIMVGVEGQLDNHDPLWKKKFTSIACVVDMSCTRELLVDGSRLGSLTHSIRSGKVPNCNGLEIELVLDLPALCAAHSTTAARQRVAWALISEWSGAVSSTRSIIIHRETRVHA